MTWRARADALFRGVFVAICAVTATYALFAYVPFTYTQVIQSRLIEPLNLFAAWHAAFLWGGAVALTLGVRSQLRERYASAWTLVIVVTGLAAWVTWRPVLANLANGDEALGVGVLALSLILWCAGVESAALRSRVRWVAVSSAPVTPADEPSRLFVACVLSGVYIWALYVIAAWLRSGDPRWATEATWSLPAHLVLFGGFFVLSMLVRAVSHGSATPARTEFALVWVTALVTTSVLVQRVVFGAIAFRGPIAWVIAVAVALAMTTTWATWDMRVAIEADVSVESGVGAWFVPAGRRWSRRGAALALTVLGVVAVTTVNRAAAMDWNYLVQMLSAVATWVVAFSICYAASPVRRIASARALIAAACLAPCVLAGVQALRDRQMADQLAGFNPSFRLLASAVIPTPPVEADAGLYDFLQANTNIPRARRVAPVAVLPAGRLTRSGATERPNIFVFVVDSLRRDYLQPYNARVAFTPSIQAFAHENLVYTNAFTRYGATGLSEPSIWVGGMLVHKQYVTPFAPMNALAALLDVEGYRPYVSVDSILRTVLPSPMARLTELDRGRSTKDYDLCRSLTELSAAVTATHADAAPIFAYTQAQNIHISTITREGATVIGDGRYDGFYAPYASRLRRIDGCFGRFIDHLKALGEYERSVIVLTADHGDSLGEEGRWGHAYTIFPEILRIPLIVHLPASLAPRLNVRTDAVAFSTDISPTLYEILGHSPTAATFPLGQPLATYAPRTPHPRPGDHLVASSYGTVYGVIRDDGRRLYIVDAVNFQDYAYDLTRGLVGTRVEVRPDDRGTGQRAIRQQVETIARFYRLGEEPGPAGTPAKPAR